LAGRVAASAAAVYTGCTPSAATDALDDGAAAATLSTDGTASSATDAVDCPAATT
jgi:hypothetical protein